MELRCGSLAPSYQNLKDQSLVNVSDTSFIHRKQIEYPFETLGHSYELPRIPPWFVHVGYKKLYDTLAGVLRLVDLSLLVGIGNVGRSDILLYHSHFPCSCSQVSLAYH